MKITVELGSEIEIALSLLTEEEQRLTLQRFTNIDAYAVACDIEELWEAELKMPGCNIERVARLASAYRMLTADDDDHSTTRAFLDKLRH